MTDVVHLSFVGGGIFLPNDGPADRQDLVDYVAHLLHSKPNVEILRADQRWMAERTVDCYGCTRCGRASTTVCYETSNDAAAYCLRCALETDEDRSNGDATPVRQRGHSSPPPQRLPREKSLAVGLRAN